MRAGTRSVRLDTPAAPPDPDVLPASQRARRDRIVRAAIELLDAAEYDAVQMRDVAERAGVALGTLYRYFSSKEHLYAAALVAWSADYGEPRRTAALDAMTDEARLRALLHRTVRAFERSPQMLRVHMVVERSADPNAAALHDQFAAAHVAVLRGALRDVEPDLAPAVVNTVIGVLSSWLCSWDLGRGSIRDVDAAVQDAIGLIFGGPPVPAGSP
jgi:TetR/AcrR family transcriptional regulator, cholesterol catabolism regulator